MDYRFLIVLALAVMILTIPVSRKINRRSMRRRLIAQWGKVPGGIEQDSLDDIKNYWIARKEAEEIKNFVDDTTWEDLDMDKVYQSFRRTGSIVGDELLYATLRDTGMSDDAIKRRVERVDFFMSDEQARLCAQMALRRINKARFHNASAYLYNAQLRLPKYWLLYFAQVILFFMAFIVGFFHTPFFFVAAKLFVLNMVVYYVTMRRIQPEMCALRHIASVVNCAKEITRMQCAPLNPEIEHIKERLRAITPVRLWFSMFELESAGAMDIFTEYIKLLFMLDLISFCAIVRGISRWGLAVRAIYEGIGALDVDVALASVRMSANDLCRAQFHDAMHVNATAMTHPLIKEAVPNDVTWNQNMLVTGSNASGKSTFIKAIAVNAILAQTVGFCYAQSFQMSRARVMSSMAIRDSIVRGESYFIAEIRSLKRLLDGVNSGERVLCFVDEILRGTNTIERIAASCCVLRAMTAPTARCVAATHDIELTQMLDDAYGDWHFSESVTDAGISFDYCLRDGPATGRNAIALLKQMGYGEEIVNGALDAVQAFECNRKWETS